LNYILVTQLIWKPESKITIPAGLRVPHIEALLNYFFVNFTFLKKMRELYFKTTMGKKAIKLMLRTTLEKMKYKGTLIPLNIVEDSISD